MLDKNSKAHIFFNGDAKLQLFLCIPEKKKFLWLKGFIKYAKVILLNK